MVSSRVSVLHATLLCVLIIANSASGQKGFQGFTLHGNAQGKKMWSEFKERFVSPEGRVIDDANGGISHSEGQGYGMLLAADHRDLSTFSILWSWTRKNLQVREDGLFAWKWDPSLPSNHISDPNNATDGDILIAWALLRAGELWKNERYIEDAKTIVRTLRRTMIVDSRYGPLLLPGGTGFIKPEGTIVNLSYWVFPAFLDIRRIDPSHIWNDLYLSGTRLLSEAQFGKWNLPPDWLLVSETEPPSLPQEFDPVYGYNAVRIPLYLYWGGDTQKSLYQPFIDWAVHDENIYQLPDIINLVTNSPGDYTALPGMIAIYHLIAPRQITDSGNTGENYASYYSACLRLLCTVAEKESRTYSALPRP